MNFKYKINDNVYYNNETPEVFKVQSITLDEHGIIYTIANEKTQLIAKEDELFTKLNNEVLEHYMLYPVSIKSSEKYYDELYVYKIKSADISILRPAEHRYSSYIDYECELVGKIKTNVLRNNNITIPKCTDSIFFKIDKNEQNQLVLEFNKHKSKLLNFVEIYYDNDCNKSHRLLYQNCMDDFILSINPAIRNVIKSLDDVIYLETSRSNYVVVDGKIVSREQLTPNTTINYFGVGNIQVDINLINAYKQDSKVLPDLYLYSIENIKLNYTQLQKIITDTILLELEDIRTHSKSFDYEEIINHKINEIKALNVKR